MAELLSRSAPGRLLAVAGVAALLVVVPARRAAADGAFPDAQNVLTPADLPAEIVLATNFGVVLSHDGGSTWLWTCEQDANILGWLYQISPAPRNRVFTLANKALAYSDDLTCGWHVAGGGLADQEVSDAWVDRTSSERVLAVGVHCCEGADNIYTLFESLDGGTLFGAPRYVARAGDTISGVESAASNPKIIYMTMSVGKTYQPAVARSSDGGVTWQVHDLGASLGKGNLRLIAIDPANPEKVFLLWNDPDKGQAVAVSEDGGRTATVRLAASGSGEVINAFLRTASGALLVATDLNTTPRLLRSRDGGTTFEELPGAPHIRSLSQRGPLIYAATNNFADGYALATSRDDGTTWSPLMSYDQVRGIAACARSACQDKCTMLPPDLWSLDVCSADTTSPDASADHPPDARPDGGGGGGVSGGNGGGGGCGCSLVAPLSGAPIPLAPALGLALVSVLVTLRRRRR